MRDELLNNFYMVKEASKGKLLSEGLRDLSPAARRKLLLSTPLQTPRPPMYSPMEAGRLIAGDPSYRMLSKIKRLPPK